MKQVAGQLKGDLAQFREMAAFAQFGSELDAKTQSQIDRGKRIMEIFKQPQHKPIPVEVQVAVIWAVQNGYMDGVRDERVKEFQTKFTEFLAVRKVELLAKIEREKAISDALKAELKTVADNSNRRGNEYRPGELWPARVNSGDVSSRLPAPRRSLARCRWSRRRRQ